MSNILKLSLLLIFAFLFTQCFGEINDREGCDGSIELINPIPDATVAQSQNSLTTIFQVVKILYLSMLRARHGISIASDEFRCGIQTIKRNESGYS